MTSVRRLTNLGAAVGVAVLFFLLLRYIAEFSLKQSIVLAVIALIALVILESRTDLLPLRWELRRTRLFSPHLVSIRIKWLELLLNYRLLGEQDELEFRRLSEEGSIENWMHFTVLRCHHDEDRPALIQTDNRFATEVDLWEYAPKFGLDPYFKETNSLLTPRVRISHWTTPSSWVRIRGKQVPSAFTTIGYVLSLELNERWWNRLTKEGAVRTAPLSVDTTDGTTTLHLAVLPLSEFGEYYVKWNAQHRNQELAEHGWKPKEEENPSIEHRFFEVSHERI